MLEVDWYTVFVLFACFLIGMALTTLAGMFYHSQVAAILLTAIAIVGILVIQ
jgi:hypothetical protein